jgi:Leucine-rich repeat (LRR) protein
MEDGKAIKVFYNRTRIPDAALRPVKYLPTLKILNISDTAVTDAGLEYLKGLKELRRLYPHGSGLTDVGIEEIRVALPDLEVLQ